jgi:cell volume regulation protein A
MNLTTENILLVGSILLFVSLVAGKTSHRFGVPVLLFFLAVGMIAGSEGIIGIQFDNPKTAQFIGIIALNFILFSGGFETDARTIKPILGQGISLSTLGVLLTAGSVGVFVWAVTDFSLYEGLLLGSIVSSTDSAAVFSILRSKGLALKGSLRPTLELESGSNDPMAYVLTIVFTSLVAHPEGGWLEVLPMFFGQLIIGSLMGFLMGKAGKAIINHIRLDYESLYVVLVIALMFFSFSAADFVGGNGFLAVYIAAVYLGNHNLIHKKTIIKSFDSFAWLMQIVLFLTLGLLVFPSQVISVMGIGLVISAFLILVARPLSVFIATAFFNVQNRSRLFLGWMGLRGAVPIVFATYPMIAGIEKAQMIFNIVFFISVTSVLIQGTTLPKLARWMHVSLPGKARQRTLTDLELEERLKSILSTLEVPAGCPVIGIPIVHLGLPKTTLIPIISRDHTYLIPNGSTTIQAGDILYVLSENQQGLDQVFQCIGANETAEFSIPHA